MSKRRDQIKDVDPFSVNEASAWMAKVAGDNVPEGADDREGGGDPKPTQEDWNAWHDDDHSLRGGDPFEEQGNTGHDDPDPDADFALPPSGNPQAVERAWRDAGKVGDRRAAVEAAEAYPATTGNPQADQPIDFSLGRDPDTYPGEGRTFIATNAQINTALRALESRHKADLKRYRQEKNRLMSYLILLLEFRPLHAVDPGETA